MKLIFLGDSTMQTNYANTYPQVGWPQALPMFILDDIKIINYARNGCSTKSFIDLGLFKKALDVCEEGDFCFIQFGHNDAKIDNTFRHTDPFTTYSQNLIYFINSIKEKGATPILITSIYRRHFDELGIIKDNCHLEYPSAMKKVAFENDVYLIDLCEATKSLLQNLGDENSKRLFMNFENNIYDKYPNGLSDNSHLRFDGAYEISKLFIQNILSSNHCLRDIVRDEVKDYLVKQ